MLIITALKNRLFPDICTVKWCFKEKCGFLKITLGTNENNSKVVHLPFCEDHKEMALEVGMDIQEKFNKTF